MFIQNDFQLDNLKVPRHPSFLLKIKIIVLLVCKSISSNHPFIYPTIHLFAISIHLSIYPFTYLYINSFTYLYINPPIHHSINPVIHLYTNPSIHQSIYTPIHIYTNPLIHLFISLSLSLSLLYCHPLSFPSQFYLTHWHARTFCMRSKRSSFSQSVSQSACVLIILFIFQIWFLKFSSFGHILPGPPIHSVIHQRIRKKIKERQNQESGAW